MKYQYAVLSVLILISIFGCKARLKGTDSLTDNLIGRKDSLAFELCQIFGSDQGVRLSEGFPDKMKLIQSIDTFNFNRVTDFVRKNGFPTEKLLGSKYIKVECVQSCVYSVLLHNPHRLVNEKEHFDLFLNEVKKGNLEANFFATILDKYYWTKSTNKENRRVFYGSQFGKPCIQTKEATNKARVEIGLKPLADDGFVDCGGEKLDMPKERK